MLCLVQQHPFGPGLLSGKTDVVKRIHAHRHVPGQRRSLSYFHALGFGIQQSAGMQDPSGAMAAELQRRTGIKVPSAFFRADGNIACAAEVLARAF